MSCHATSVRSVPSEPPVNGVSAVDLWEFYVNPDTDSRTDDTTPACCRRAVGAVAPSPPYTCPGLSDTRVATPALQLGCPGVILLAAGVVELLNRGAQT